MGIDPHYIVGERGGYRSPPLDSGGGERAWRGVGIDPHYLVGERGGYRSPPLDSGGGERGGVGWVDTPLDSGGESVERGG